MNNSVQCWLYLISPITRIILNGLSPWCRPFQWAFAQRRKSYYFWGAARKDRRTPCRETSWNLGLCFCSLWPPVKRKIWRDWSNNTPTEKRNSTNANYTVHFVSGDAFCTEISHSQLLHICNNTFCVQVGLVCWAFKTSNILSSLWTWTR